MPSTVPIKILEADASRPANAIRRRWPWRRVAFLAIAAFLIALGIEAYRVMFGSNFHAVVPGRIFRCAQPTASALDRMIGEHGIRTVVNLRGPCDPFDWYLDEARVAHNHSICMEDISFSAGRLPPVQEVRRLVEVLDRTDFPILMHCRRGADRTGLAAAIALLLMTDSPLDDACQQLGWRFGHVAAGRPGQLNQFLAFYSDWLTTTGKTHSKDVFRQWVLNHYCPGSCWAEMAFLKPPPTSVIAADPTAYHLRVRNASLLPWVFRPQWTAGVHLGCHIYDEQDQLIDVVKSGLRDAVVRPGESMDFVVAIPPLRKPGRYRVQLDLLDEQQCWFYQTGSQPLELELIVHE